MKLTKTIQIDVLPLTSKKKGIIDRVMKDFCWVANETAKRLPSLPDDVVTQQYNKLQAIEESVDDKKRGHPFCTWYKEFRNTVDLGALCTVEAIKKARGNYNQMLTTKEERWKTYREQQEDFKKGISKKKPRKPKKIPTFIKNNIVRWHNQTFNFEKHGKRIYVNVPTAKYKINRCKRILIPLKGVNYQYKFLERVMKKQLKQGTGELKRYEDGSYKFNLCITTNHVFDNKRSKSKKESIICSIDLGLNNMTWITILKISKDKNPEMLFTKRWSGKEAGFIRNRFNNRRKELQEKGLLKEVKKSKGKESNWMKTLNNNISAEIVEICKKHKARIIVFERLKNIRKTTQARCGLKGKSKKRQLRRLSSWPFAQLKEMIKYKALTERIKTTEVRPYYTSLTCNKCKFTPKKKQEFKDTRNGSNFQCQQCGYQVNADFNATINIGNRFAGYLYGS